MDPSSIVLPNSLQNAAVLTVVLAFAGYLVTFMFTRMMARRADRLKLVNQRLNEFYGPLYVASQAGNIAYRSLLRSRARRRAHPILDSEMKEWVLWMTTIFMPLNDIREKIIIEKAHLIVEEQMPHCLLDFVTHVVGYKAVLAKWARGRLQRAAIDHRLAARVRLSMWSGPTRRSRPSRRGCCTTWRGARTGAVSSARAVAEFRGHYPGRYPFGLAMKGRESPHANLPGPEHHAVP